MILSASCGVEPHSIINYKKLLDEALQISLQNHGFIPNFNLIYQRENIMVCDLNKNDLDWSKEISNVKESDHPKCEVMDSSDPLYILYTSGTTGKKSIL
jgi:propionyl-CoA synthetase